MRLTVNDTISIQIYSSNFWNDTDIDIQTGDEYKFEATGFWKDLFLTIDADGYSNLYVSLFNKFKRSKNNQWFALMGSLNHTGDFLIGKDNQIVFNVEGKLSCYANDVKGFYWNNSGQVLLRVTRLK